MVLHCSQTADSTFSPHTLPASTLLAAHMRPIYTQQNSQLNARLQTQSSQNASLATDLARQREEMDELRTMLRRALADLDGAAAVVGRASAGGGAGDVEMLAVAGEELLGVVGG